MYFRQAVYKGLCANDVCTEVVWKGVAQIWDLILTSKQEGFPKCSRRHLCMVS